MSAVELCVLIISSVLNQEMDHSVHVSFSFIEFQIGDPGPESLYLRGCFSDCM